MRMYQTRRNPNSAFGAAPVGQPQTVPRPHWPKKALRKDKTALEGGIRGKDEGREIGSRLSLCRDSGRAVAVFFEKCEEIPCKMPRNRIESSETGNLCRGRSAL